MHINKYLLGVSSVVIIGSIGWLSAGALTISNSNFAKGFPIFKTIFFRSEGKDSINGSTNPEGVRLDSSGIYTAVPNGLPGGGGNVLKLNGAGQIYMDPVQNGNLANNSISNIKISNNSIVNSNFADLAITNTQIQNNSIQITKFDPGIIWPTGGTMYITNNVCITTNAIISVNNGTATCALLPTGGTATLPTCSAGQQPVFSGGVWGCQVLLLGAGSGDPYRTGLTISSVQSSITNSNAGNVGVGTNNPTQKLTVSGSLEILGSIEDQVYCYATDTWVLLSSYNASACAGCNAGFHYNATTSMCEQSSCVGTGPTLVNGSCGSANGGTFAIAPNTNLCSAGSAGTVNGTGPWTWTCNGTGGGLNASCSANITTNNTCGGYAGPIYVKRTLVNNVSSSQNSDPLCGGRPNGQTSDVWDCQYDFYSDAAGTIPVSVTNLIVDTYRTTCYGYCSGSPNGSFVANGTSHTQVQCKWDYIEDFPPAGCGTSYGGETTMTNSTCAQEVSGTPPPSENLYIINNLNFGNQINSVTDGGFRFYVTTVGAFPITTPTAPNNEVRGTHAGLAANAMDIEVSNGGGEWCVYTFINNPPTPGNCNPVGFTSQTQGGVGQTNAAVIAPAFSSTDRVDLLVCDGICN